MTSLLCFQAHTHNFMKQAVAVTRTQDQHVLYARVILESNSHSVMCVFSSHGRLTQLRMDRENAEARARDMEDQLAELQDELRREGGSKTVSNKHMYTNKPTQTYWKTPLWELL